MHFTSLENMQKCYERYICNETWLKKSKIDVIDIGGANINGSYRDIFSNERFIYKAVDLVESYNVDIVLKDPYKLPFKDNSIDIVISGQVFEHAEYFWKSFAEMIRILKNDGILFLIAPSAGPIHRYPVDCYRFYPDSYKALAKNENCYLIDCWLDNRGPWKDLVGVFSKTKINRYQFNLSGNADKKVWMNSYMSNQLPGNQLQSNAAEERVYGTVAYLDVLKALHESLKPNLYLEIGVRSGNSLRLSVGPTISIDPDPLVDINKLKTNQALYRTTSDNFFEFLADKEIGKTVIDLAFIDGMHHFEFVLKDFINIEKYANRNTIVAIDDVFPNHPAQAERRRRTWVWTGDVWKITYCLKKYRPELELKLLDTKLSGLLLVKGLNCNNQVLIENFTRIVNEFNHDGSGHLNRLWKEVIPRAGAVKKNIIHEALQFVNKRA